MSRQAQSLTAAFAVRLFLVFLVYVQWGPCLQQGDSQNWIFGSLGIALGRPALYMPSLVWPPLFKLLAASAFKTFGFSTGIVRAIETALGLAGIALAYRLALRLYGPSAAFVCALLTALLPIAASLSLSGLAEPLYLVLMEAFFLAYLADLEDGSGWRLHAAATLAMAAAVVTRYEALGFYGAFVAMEAWRFRKGRRPGAAVRLLSAALVPAVFFALWVFYYRGRAGDAFFWIHITRDDNAQGFLRGFGPSALVPYVFRRAWRHYSWFCAVVPAAAAVLWAGARPRSLSARFVIGAALANAAALVATASVRLLSSDAERNFYVPFVLLLPGAAFLLTRAGERLRRVLPQAAALAGPALLAAALAWQCARMASANGWCFPNEESAEGCELGGTLRGIVDRTGGRGKSMACRQSREDFSCVGAVVCSGLPALADEPFLPPSGTAFYLLGPCDAESGALLARAGEKCLYQRGAR